VRSTYSRSGKSSAVKFRLVDSDFSEKLESGTVTNEQAQKTFGNWKPETGSSLKSNPCPMETWRLMQARSILGYVPTSEQLMELSSRMNLETREPINSATPPHSRFARALRALRLAMGSVLLGMGVSACANPSNITTGKVYVAAPNADLRYYVVRTYDHEYGVACYIRAYSDTVSCVQVRQGTKP
jgi:hypothetical protein